MSAAPALPGASPGALVRPAAPADVEAIAEINAYYVTETLATFDETPRSTGEWLRILEDRRARGLPFLVADVDGSVAGYAYAGPWRPKPAYRHTAEDTIYLAPGHTGRGLGTALLNVLLTESAAAGIHRMIAVIADTGDGGSLALHRRFGFTEAGRLTAVGHKHGQWIDTILMQRALTDH
ncbi:GNAT family N-acetyltransferase [Streptomyces poonensis]|uniref:Phosphinothricin N-acetyltransferase n=1 Tax=Streptomyces poonensis TaxID=68255 RepID=A0A918PIL0_9ACTN|nr:GNAT family N-acetyltransferase [Streptomyces poonensis]GGZ12303.1 phosphinothricin N-acetyltransferase [Streptomyces poonensis]GLJ93676.1 phosphinothricin N-acetyltransferase [Streptomyces poonensis]